MFKIGYESFHVGRMEKSVFIDFFFTFLQYQPHNFALENQQTGHLAFCRIFYVKNHKAYPRAAAKLL